MFQSPQARPSSQVQPTPPEEPSSPIRPLSQAQPSPVARQSTQPLASAFICAYRGVMLCLRTSRNFRIQLAVAALALILGAFLALERWEWCAIIFCIVMVLAAEAFNSALERTVDLTCHGYDERAGAAKDLAAGAVLLLSAGAVLIGLAIFIAAAVRLLP